MRNKIIITSIFLVLVYFFSNFQNIYSWGFFGHKRINRMAVFTLPPEMITFYKYHIEYITENAVNPDKRRYAVDGEAPRHYIDIDVYAPEGANPFDSVPRNWYDAVAKYTEDTLQAYGIVPWHIDVMVKRLTQAFKDKDLDRILFLSADLGHYVGDSHVPLHTTVNYNGHLTNQRGIHAFWESRVPELNADDYDYFVGRAKYISKPLDYAWETVEESHWQKDSVLKFEKELSEEFSPDQKYVFETRGTVTMKQYSQPFSDAYDKKLNGMVERKLRKSIIAVGSFWYTAWVDAGQPDLTSLLNQKISEKFKKEIEELNKKYEAGKIHGRDHE